MTARIPALLELCIFPHLSAYSHKPKCKESAMYDRLVYRFPSENSSIFVGALTFMFYGAALLGLL